MQTFSLTTLVFIAFALFSQAWAQTGYERPPIDYLNAEVDDAIARLTRRIDADQVQLVYEPQHGYLKSVLKALDVPEGSQTLVFSKTSLQLHRISPRRPRALYFNDDVYVGWCQNGDVLEFAATDAKQGATFYTLRQNELEQPKFVRDRGQCLTCHASTRTQGVPGYLIRSVFADHAGQPLLGSGTFNIDHTSPLVERWGGWYVTGIHGTMRHMGNRTYTVDDTRGGERESGANLESLAGIVSTEPYLTQHSDIVALMVMEHQTQMQNAIAAANYETRMALHQSFEMNALLEREPGYISESCERRINAAAEKVIRYLLMCDEFALSDRVSGTSGYSQWFASQGVRDSQDRSLRDFDLSQRLFRYPCSYMIYNVAFDALPDQVRRRVLARLLDILQERDNSPAYAHLTTSMRREILEILLDTKTEIKQLASEIAPAS